MELVSSFKTFIGSPDIKFYRCTIKNQIINKDSAIKLSTQHHEQDKTINDVTYVQFEDCSMEKIPKGLSKVFPGMKVLFIFNSKLKKISKNDLIEYKHLVRFHSERNDHEYIPGDLFEDFKSLEWISICGSKLKIIEPNILDGLENLQVVRFLQASLFDQLYSIYPEHGGNSSLDEFKDKLLKTFLTNDLQTIKNYLNKLQNLSQKGLFGDLKAYIKDDSSKDIKIHIDDREFHVHKLLLTIRSPPIAEILRNNPEAANLNLVDIPVDIFETILKFLYTDELPADEDQNFMQLFVAANRLQIKELKNFAATEISNRINAVNAMDIFNMSHKYDQEELRKKSFEEVKKMYPKIEFKDEWASNPEKVVKIIEGYKKMEEEIRKQKDEFESLMTEN
ncbi:hypothetical protein ACKWTF_015051 [Chironomus riparius]